MEIKVKEVGIVEEKSAAQVEETLIEKVEQQHEEQPQAVEQTTVPEETQGTELREEDVLGYIKNRYDKDISSVDDLFAQRESNGVSFSYRRRYRQRRCRIINGGLLL